MYQIFSDEVLGSGQFGIVYGGMFLFLLNSDDIYFGKTVLNYILWVLLFFFTHLTRLYYFRQTQKERQRCSYQGYRQDEISHQAGESAKE